MKRVILIVLITLAVAIGAAVYVAYTSLDSIVKTAIEKIGSDVTGTQVRLDKVKISPASGEGALRGLRIENPQGFERTDAFQFDEISMKIDMGTLTKDPVVIREIVIARPRIRYEIGAGKTNVGHIQKSVESHSPKPAKEAKAARKGPNVLIKDLLFRDGEITVAQSTLLAKGLTVPLPDLHLTDVGSAERGGATPADLAKEILKNLLATTTKSVGTLDLRHLGQTASQALETGIKPLENAAGTLQKDAEKAKEQATDTAKQLGRKLGDLLERKR